MENCIDNIHHRQTHQVEITAQKTVDIIVWIMVMLAFIRHTHQLEITAQKQWTSFVWIMVMLAFIRHTQQVEIIAQKIVDLRKSTKTTLLTKYKHICTLHHQLHIQTLYIIQNVLFTMVKRHLSNGQLSRKVVQRIYVGCPRLMQIY